MGQRVGPRLKVSRVQASSANGARVLCNLGPTNLVQLYAISAKLQTEFYRFAADGWLISTGTSASINV